VFFTVFINIFFILTKGAKNIVSIEAEKAAWISVLVAAGCAVLAAGVGFPLMRKKLAALSEDAPAGKAIQSGFEEERTDDWQERVARAMKVGCSLGGDACPCSAIAPAAGRMWWLHARQSLQADAGLPDTNHGT
jgi:hypothetical protein